MSYRSYWTRVVLQALEVQRGNLSVKDISELTAIRPDDIVKTLESLSLIKYWKVGTSAAVLFSTPMSLQSAHCPAACGLGLWYNYHAHDAARLRCPIQTAYITHWQSALYHLTKIQNCFILLLHAVATASLPWLTACSGAVTITSSCLCTTPKGCHA